MAKRKRIKPDVLPIPKMLQDIIPAVKVYPDGIMENVKGRYSKSFIFSDINYRTASLEAKKSIAEKYKELINSLDVRSRVQITVNKRKINFEEFEKTTLLSIKDDELDEYREEYNKIMTDALKESNMMIRECYFTISIEKNTFNR